MSQVLVVSGTGTDVGKTIVTAAIAANAMRDGRSVAVVKPGQTGVGPDEPGDLASVRSLTASVRDAVGLLSLHEFVRYPDPLAPATAARTSGRSALLLTEAVNAVKALMALDDLVIVEGAGGLLVRYSDDPVWTIADLARELHAPVVVVVHAALGTLHHTASTLEALSSRSLEAAGLVIGSWPDVPGLAERSNLVDLPKLGAPLVGAIRTGAGDLAGHEFADAASSGLSPSLGGTFDAAHFTQTYEPEIPL